MKKLILAALGVAAWRWLAAPAQRNEPAFFGNQPSQPKRDGPRRQAGTSSDFAQERWEGSRSPSHADVPGTDITYRVVEHDDGWAYKVGDVFSETFSSHDAALEAARIAAREHELAGEPEPIEYQDEQGKWRREDTDGRDRPHTQVEDTQSNKG